jgi:hypothetical protein
MVLRVRNRRYRRVDGVSAVRGCTRLEFFFPRIENGFKLHCSPFTGRPFVKILPLFLALLASGQVNAFAQQAPPSGSQMNGDLQELITTLQKIVDDSIASKQGEKLSIQLESMRVPGYQTWFPATFGPENGAKLAALYSESFPKQESRLLEYFVAHGERGGRVEARQGSHPAAVISKKLNSSGGLTRRFVNR